MVKIEIPAEDIHAVRAKLEAIYQTVADRVAREGFADLERRMYPKFVLNCMRYAATEGRP